ncbi:MAG: hypothetical protein Q8N28_01335 [bacterium]|nr:hypothetical protein [bacterium]
MNIKNNYYKVGHLLNPLDIKIDSIVPKGKRCKIIVPARVDTFLCHHHYFVYPPRPQVYPVNSINFSLCKFTKADVSIRNDKKIIIDASNNHKTIIEHVVKIIQKTLNIEMGFNVSARNLHEISHGGLGSSAAIMSAVAQAINILMGNALSISQMTKLLAQNYGEETTKKGFLSTMASIGGATAVALSGHSLVIIGGEAEIRCLNQIPKEYCAVLLYPKNMKSISGVTDIRLYRKGFPLFKNMSTEWGDIKENMLKTKIIPAVKKNDYSVLFKAINMYTIGAYGDIPQYFKYRWASHNIFFDSFIYSIFSKLFGSLKIDENCFFVSSGGPLIVIITKHYKKAVYLLGYLKKDFIINKVSLYKRSSNFQLLR